MRHKCVTAMVGISSAYVTRFPAPRLFAKAHAASLGTLVFCCGDVIVCHIWQCLQQTSRGHCVLVASGNAQQSPRGLATAALTTIRNCKARSSSGVGVTPTQQVLCLRGVGWDCHHHGPTDAYAGPPPHIKIWTSCGGRCAMSNQFSRKRWGLAS